MRRIPLVLLFALTGASSTPTRVEPKTGLELILLPGGSFRFGCEPQDEHCGPNEKPPRGATVEPFWLMKTPVTVAAWAKCVQAGACATPLTGGNCTWGVRGKENHPVTCINWNQAIAFCAWVGGRLPTSEEWEFAAKGGGSRIYPWGDEPVTAHRANFCDKRCYRKHPDYLWAETSLDDGWEETAPVGSYPQGATPQGLLDMAGNVSQWTNDTEHPHLKEVRGGCWGDELISMRASNRGYFMLTDTLDGLGVRCLIDATAPHAK